MESCNHTHCDGTKKAKVVGQYVVLPSGRKIRLYKTLANGTVKINPMFSKLWIDLFWTDSFTNTTSARDSLEPFYQLPSMSTTALRSVGRDIDGACLWTIISNLKGPITDAGNAVLNTPFDTIELRFKWVLTEPTTISFYSEAKDGRILPVMDTCGNMAIYPGCSLTGEFTTSYYQQYVITTSKTVGVLLYVSVVIPEEPEFVVIPSTKVLVGKYPKVLTVPESTKFLRYYYAGSFNALSEFGNYVTIYTSETTEHKISCILSIWSFTSEWLSPVVYKNPTNLKRTVIYTADIAANAAPLGTPYKVRLFKNNYDAFQPQMIGKIPIYRPYEYTGAITITGTMELEPGVADAILMLSFVGPTNNTENAVRFTSVIYYAEDVV